VPASPELVEVLRRHLDDFPDGVNGRIFVTRTGRAGVPLAAPFQKPLSMGIVYRVWDRARADALTEREYQSPLARRPYDLRHAAVSLWLNAGVSNPSGRLGRPQRAGPAQGVRELRIRPGDGGHAADRRGPRQGSL
jgi:hypothetical protein